jgi:hypothetical protein
MKVKEIRNFVNKLIDVPIVVHYNNKKVHELLLESGIDTNALLEKYASVAMTTELIEGMPIGMIILNRSTFRERDVIGKKALLLHEVGHIYNKVYMDEDNEYLAQQWAIAMTYSMNGTVTKKNIRERLEEEIEHIWGMYTWNEAKGAYRRYIKAHKMYISWIK